MITSLSELEKSGKKNGKRVGRGVGSGKGKTCGRGTKGAKARSGYKKRHGNEGGQLPVFRKIPIRGFTRGRFKKEVFSINVSLLEKYFADGDTINLETLQKKHFLSKKKSPLIKILGNGDLKKSLHVHVHSISKGAKEKITKSKGTVKLLS